MQVRLWAGLGPARARGATDRALPAPALLLGNVSVYGVGGVLLPFPCIELIDLALAATGAL
jgi:K+-transporting ATPase ATPase B chain